MGMDTNKLTSLRPLYMGIIVIFPVIYKDNFAHIFELLLIITYYLELIIIYSMLHVACVISYVMSQTRWFREPPAKLDRMGSRCNPI